MFNHSQTVIFGVSIEDRISKTSSDFKNECLLPKQREFEYFNKAGSFLYITEQRSLMKHIRRPAAYRSEILCLTIFNHL